MNKPIQVVEGKTQPFEAFWRVRDAVQTGGEPEIEFYGFISEWSWFGDEITPKKFREDLYATGKGGPITVRINSPGGEIFAASAIRSTLLDYPGQVTVKIDGLAASAAVAVALSGNRIQIFDTAYMMIHNPGYSLLGGWLTSDILNKFAEELVMFKEGLLNAYGARTGLERERLSKMLDEETWMTAQQAVDLGFADEVITGGSPLKPDQKQAVRSYINVPASLWNDTPTPSQPSEVRFARERERLEAVQSKSYTEVNMNGNLRSLLQEREALLERATALLELADQEARDFTPEERLEYEEILGAGENPGKIGALEARIEQVQADRERLRLAAEKKLGVTNEPQKPDGQGEKRMKRVDFDQLDTDARAAFIKSGGKLE